MAVNLPVPYPTDGLIEQKTGRGFRRDLWNASSFDFDYEGDSFKGDALNARYPAAKTNGASAAVTHTEHNVHGFVEMVSGTDDDGYAGQGFGMNWTGDRGLLAQFVVKLPSAITTLKFEVGLSDADDDAGAVNVKGTSATATDFAVFIFDTDHNTQLDFETAKGGTIQRKTNLHTVAASDVIRFAIRVDGDNAVAFINGQRVAEVGGALALEGGNGITPWVFAQARAVSASRTLEWHKWGILEPSYD